MSATILVIRETSLITKTINNMLYKRNPPLKTLIGTRKKDVGKRHIHLNVDDLKSFESLKKNPYMQSSSAQSK